MARPVLYVLAGVNGAGKSSVGGHLLERAGLTWFNPDTFARELIAASGCGQEDANARAWADGVRRLDEAIAGRRTYAFETTLGGRTVASKILGAARTHDVMIWFCGLDSPEHHIARVRFRAAHDGHDIPDATIRARYPRAQRNLIRLMPHVAHLQVYDNSADAASGAALPDPVLLLEMKGGKVTWPARRDHRAIIRTPDWARALVEAALSSADRGA